jgi:hypothetical protein
MRQYRLQSSTELVGSLLEKEGELKHVNNIQSNLDIAKTQNYFTAIFISHKEVNVPLFPF